MTRTISIETFIAEYDSETDAIEDILIDHYDGRVETVEYTIPYYTYNSLANPPRFIAYSSHQPQRHSIEVRIKCPLGIRNDTVIVFPTADLRAMDWFNKHLANELCDGYGEFETEEVNIADEYELERTALDLQRSVNYQRINKTRRYIIENGGFMFSDQFERHCRDLVNLLDENKVTQERILYIESIQHPVQKTRRYQ